MTINAGESKELTLSGKIPVTADQGTNDIGTLTVTSSAGPTSHPLKTEVRNMLEIDEINIYVDEHKEKTVDSNNEDLKDLVPGSKVQLGFRLKNLFDNDYDEGDIDGDITITLDDSDFDDDVDESEEFTLDAGDKHDSKDQEIVLEFEIPQQAKAGTYNLDIKVEGEDGNNAKYAAEWTLKLKVERENDDVRVSSLTVSPEEAVCGGNVKITAEVVNFGDDRQRHAALVLENADLGIDENLDFVLESGTDDDYSVIKVINFEVPADLAAGTYAIKASAYYDYNRGDDFKTVNLVVKACSEVDASDEPTETASDDTEEEEEEVVVLPSSGETEDDGADLISSSVVVETTENSFTPSDIMMIILSAAIVLVLALLVLFALILLK